MTHRTLVLAAALLLIAVSGTACGVPTQRTAHRVPDRDVPSGLLSISTSTTTSTASTRPRPQTVTITICLAQNTAPLKAVQRRVAPYTTVTDLLEILAQPPTAQELSAGLSTGLTAGLAGTLTGGIATVALTTAFTTASTTDQLTAVAQIVCTLTAQPGIGQVQFELHDKPTDIPRGDGSTTSTPVSRNDYPTLMPSDSP
jgi:spore germination protein GerM